MQGGGNVVEYHSSEFFPGNKVLISEIAAHLLI